MLRQALCYCLIVYIKCVLSVTESDNFGACNLCIQIEECLFVQNMNAQEQRIWMDRHPCDQISFGTTRIYDGFSSIAKGDQVCCPQKKQQTQDSENSKSKLQIRKGHTSSSISKIKSLHNNPHIINVRKNQEHSYKIHKLNGYINQNINRKIRQVSKETIEGNPFFLKKSLYPKRIVPNPSNNNDNRMFLEQQCEVQTSLPPDPETGCCGQDTSDADRITDLERFLPTLAPLVSNKWEQYFLPQQTPKQAQNQKTKGSTNNKTSNVTLESRIAGGNETELDQFPWTALLKILFNYGDRTVVYNCGGSLISSRYVLTAAHCVYEEGAQLTGLEITLAEYDKRTFPNDCVAVNGEGRKCIQNIVIPAEDVIIHPLYEDAWLHNDIALIRLRGFAPYTRFIRPICLTPLDVDIPDLTNLPLSVAGWGRNRQFFTNVKQSTVLNLIPHDQCERYYPNLSRNHICAAGRTGEDTCKGDSGGPLMILFRGRYYVMGVVSGKRSDSPCGTSVPSLFTNVFNYLDWIQNVIRNY